MHPEHHSACNGQQACSKSLMLAGAAKQGRIISIIRLFCLRDEQATVTKRTPTTSFGPGWPGGAHHEHHVATMAHQARILSIIWLWLGSEPGMQRPPGVHHEHHVGFGWPQWPTKRASSASFGFGCLGAGHTTATRHAS